VNPLRFGINVTIQMVANERILRFNDAKDGDAFLFLPDCKVCVSHIRYCFCNLICKFICSEAGPGELRHAADTLSQSPRRHAQQRNLN